MGKNLKGKECGKGIYQRPDGKYHARFVDKYGKRHTKYFKNLPEARNWLADAKYADRHNEMFIAPDITVDQWFNFWILNIVGDLAPNTIRNYRERYTKNIQPFIGNMLLDDVKPMHCKKILMQMEDRYAASTIRQVFITMGTLFKAAKMNDLIAKHPMDGVKFTKSLRNTNDVRCLSREEQRKFLDVAKHAYNFEQFSLILETGLRTGEMIGLTWNAIDFNNRTLTVNKTLEYRHSEHCWRAGSPKTLDSYRTIPLTNMAYEILKDVRDSCRFRKKSPLLAQTLEYTDRRKGTKAYLDMRDLVFLSQRTGEPIKNSSYDTQLYKLCEKAGIPHFCMHSLRHTYATRAIESGMQPKVLQKLLGHASIKTTMDKYVHVTNDSLLEAIKQFENNSIN